MPRSAHVPMGSVFDEAQDELGVLPPAPMSSTPSITRTDSDVRSEATFGRRPSGHVKSNVSHAATQLKRGGARMGNYVQKRVARTRRKLPFVDLVIRYMVPQVSAVLFMADIITDALVTGLYLASDEIMAKVFGALSILFIVGPLVLTAVFITRSQMRAYVLRRKTDEVRKVLAANHLVSRPAQASDHFGGATAGLTATSGAFHSHAGYLNPVYSRAVPAPSMTSHDAPSQHFYETAEGMPMIIDRRGPVIGGAAGPQRRSSSGVEDGGEGSWDASPTAAHLRQRSGAAREENGHARAGPPRRPVPPWRVTSGGVPPRPVGEAVESAPAPASTLAFEGSPQITNTTTTARHPDAQVTITMPGESEPAKARVPPSIMEQIVREARVCSFFAFPIMLLAAAGFDLALILIAIYPRVTYFIGVESIMPQYYAYRTLVEVVLEAIPQVCLQLLSLFVQPTGTDPNEDGRKFFGINAAILFSIGVAVLNLAKTLIMLRAEASSLSMGLLPYIKYLMEVGSAQLPLRSITDNSIGERLDYTQNTRSEIRPLYEALKKNSTIKYLTFNNMLDSDIRELLDVLEGRQIAYSLDITGTSFGKEMYASVILAALRGRFLEQLTFRGCRIDVAPWVHREGFTLLNYKVPKGCIDDGVPLSAAEVPERQRREIAHRLLNEWLMPCEICSVSNTNLTNPIAIRFHVPQLSSTLLAAFYFLRQHVTITALEVDYAMTPITLTALMQVLKQRPRELRSLSLIGVRAVSTREAVEALEKLLAAAPSLEAVTLSRAWDSRSANPLKLISALVRCSSLRYLKLSGSYLAETSCQALGAGLAKWSRLRELYVNGCGIDDGAAAALASAVGEWRLPSLAHVSLGGNAFSAVGMEALAGALHKSRKLREIDLSCDAADFEAPGAERGDVSPFQGPACTGVIDRPLVAAMTRLLDHVPNVISHGCEWTPGALQELLDVHVAANPSLKLLELGARGASTPSASFRSSERDAEGAPDATVADVLARLQQRLNSEGAQRVSDVSNLNLEGLPVGDLRHVASGLGDGAFQNLAYLRVACPALGGKERVVAGQAGDMAPLWVALQHAHSVVRLEVAAPASYTPPAAPFRAALNTMRRLTHLDLRRTALGGMHLLTAIAPGSGHGLQSLEVLRLDACGLGYEDAAHLGRLLAHMPRLGELSVADNALNGSDVGHLLAPWSSGQQPAGSLSVLDLSRNPLGTDGAKVLADCMRNLLSMRVLRVARSRLRSPGVRAIATAVVKACAQEGDGGGRRRAAAASASSAAAVMLSNLVELDLEHNGVGPTGTESLALALYDMQAIEKLLFAGNRPEYEGCAALMSVCVTLPSLQVLTLGGDVTSPSPRTRTLPPDTAAAVAPGSIQAGLNAAAAAVAVLPSTGRAGGLSWEGARLVISSLRHLHGLRELRLLDLGAPPSGEVDPAVVALSNCLASIPGLEVLDLRGLGMWGPMARELAAAVGELAGLTTLDLRLSAFSPQAEGVLRDLGERATAHVLLD